MWIVNIIQLELRKNHLDIKRLIISKRLFVVFKYIDISIFIQVHLKVQFNAIYTMIDEHVKCHDQSVKEKDCVKEGEYIKRKGGERVVNLANGLIWQGY